MDDGKLRYVIHAYSGTPLIRSPTDHQKLAVLTGWPY